VIALFRRFIADDDAQDLVEYALLGALIAIIGVLVWGSIVSALGDRYTDFNTNTQAVWEPPDP
jgi:Flp pilus assembly pilin Flp